MRLALTRAIVDLIEAAAMPLSDVIVPTEQPVPRNPDDALKLSEIAKITGLAEQTLRNLRYKGNGPPNMGAARASSVLSRRPRGVDDRDKREPVTTRAQALEEEGRVISEAIAIFSNLTRRESAERVWVRGGPSVDELAARIAASRERPPRVGGST